MMIIFIMIIIIIIIIRNKLNQIKTKDKVTNSDATLS